MITIIMYIIHYYILPNKIPSTGTLYDLELYWHNECAWANNFRTATIVDLVLFVIALVTILGIFVRNVILFTSAISSSEESES